MGRAIEIISGRVTFSNNVLTALTMAAGDSLTVRSAPVDADLKLLQLWADTQVANALLQLRSPKFHDNVRGLRFTIPISDTKPLLPWGVAQKLIAQDTLICEVQVADAAGDFENVALLIYYSNLPGTDARLATWDDISKRMTGTILTVDQSLATAAGGGWTGAEAINAESDLMKANTDYALLGYQVAVECCAVAWRGADTGNMRLGGPGCEIDRDITVDWFKNLSLMSGLPCIPVFNSANRAGILVDAVQDENAAAVPLTSIFAELAGGTLK